MQRHSLLTMKSLTLPPATVGGAAAPPRGFSLIELLIAATIGLVVMGAVASLFGIFGRSASETQSIVDMTNRLRGTALKLRQDLRGITCSVAPSLSPESDAGYFELIEGPATDSVDAAGNPITAATPILGDTDDVLLFTTRTAGEPFEGKFDTNLILSPVAEVAWFCRPSPPVAQIVAGVSLQTLYRRQLLVVGYVGEAPFFPTNSLGSTPLSAAYTRYDLSLRFEPLTNLLVPNTLSDLTQRENRFLHGPQWHVRFPNSIPLATFDAPSAREGEDAILTNVIGFDVRVYDPDAMPHLSGSTIVYPNEQGYGSAPAAGFKGCFLDLGCAASAATILSGTGNPRSRLNKITASGTATYDTWSTHYESNGINENGNTDSNGNPLIDEGTNGLDDNANGLVDDPLENEVPPPYAVPLRAIEVRVRCYDPVSRQVRQTTIRQAFGK